MCFYFLLLFIVFLLVGDFKLTLNKNARVQVAVLIIILIAILRFDVGFDYIAYYPTIYDNGGEEYIHEPISRAIMKLGYFVKYPPLSFAVFSLLTYILVFKSFKTHASRCGFALFVYLTFFYFTSLGVVRQALAGAICLYGFKYVKSKQLCRFVIVCTIASFAHKTAFLAIPVYFIYNYISPKFSIISILILYSIRTIILGLLQNTGLGGAPLNRVVEETAAEIPGGVILMILNPAIYVGCYLFARLKKLDIDYRIFSLLFIGSSFPFIVTAHYGDRISRYYSIYFCFLLSDIMTCLSFKLRNFVLFICLMYCMAYIRVGWNKSRPTVAPYKTIFEIENVSNPKFRT